MSLPEGSKINVRARISPATHDALTDVARRFDVYGGERYGRVDLSPLIELVGQYIDKFIELLPVDAPVRLRAKRKLSSAQVKVIRASSDKISWLAGEYGVSTCTISHIRSGKKYAWVK